MKNNMLKKKCNIKNQLYLNEHSISVTYYLLCPRFESISCLLGNILEFSIQMLRILFTWSIKIIQNKWSMQRPQTNSIFMYAEQRYSLQTWLLGQTTKAGRSQVDVISRKLCMVCNCWFSNCNQTEINLISGLDVTELLTSNSVLCPLQRGSAATLLASTTSPSCTPPVARVGGRSFCEGGDYKYSSDGEIKGI